MSKRKRKITGTCALCGRKNVSLTFEHIPPKSAYNNTKVRVIEDGIDVLEKQLFGDFSSESHAKVKWKEYQAGFGKYCLCKDCNSYTGGNYGVSYKDFVDKVVDGIKKENYYKTNEILLREIFPLRIIKQILTLFCDIAVGNYLDDIKPILLDKESNIMSLSGNCLNYRIFAVLSTANIIYTNGGMIVANLKTDNISSFSRIIAPPIGYTLYHQVPRQDIKIGVDITSFLKYKFNERVNLSIRLPIIDL